MVIVGWLAKNTEYQSKKLLNLPKRENDAKERLMSGCRRSTLKGAKVKEKGEEAKAWLDLLEGIGGRGKQKGKVVKSQPHDAIALWAKTAGTSQSSFSMTSAFSDGSYKERHHLAG